MDEANPVARTALAAGEMVELRLYVTGRNPMCARALQNLRQTCDAYLPGRYRVEVIDLSESPRLAAEDGVIAVPTVVRRSPGPVRKVVGDLSDTGSLLAGLELPSLLDDVPRPEEEVPPAPRTDARWEPVLYINGGSARAPAVVEAVRRLCDTSVTGHVGLRVVDVENEPTLALQDGNVRTRTLPEPLRRLARDVANIGRVHVDGDVDESEEHAAGSSVSDRTDAASAER